MNFQDTKEKVLKLCDKLAAEGILSKEDQEACQNSYISVGKGVSTQLPESQTSGQVSFGMTEQQSSTSLGQDLTKRQLIKGFIRSSNGIRTTNRAGEDVNPNETKNRYLALRDSSVLYMDSLDPGDLQMADAATKLVFVIKMEPNNYFSIMNEISGNYVKVTDDNKVTCDTNNLTEKAYWKMNSKVPGKIYTFESVAKPDMYLTAGIPVTLTNGKSSEQNWIIELLSDAFVDEVSNAEFEANRGRAMANQVLNTVMDIRLKYYYTLAKLDFMTTLRDKMLNMVKRDGNIMDYYYGMRANREIDISDDLLRSISVSIDSEIRQREILLIEEEMRKLVVESEKMEGEEIMEANQTITKLMTVIQRLIEEKKEQISSLNLMLERVNSKQLSLNANEDSISKRRNYQNTKGIVNIANSDISNSKIRTYSFEYWGIIILYVLALAAISFFGFKLYKKYQIYHQ